MLKKRLVGSLVAASLLLSAVPLCKAFVSSVRADENDAVEVEVSSANFPDGKMLQVAQLVDEDKNGVLTASEIEACKKIDLPSWNITDLTGIEYFYALEELNVDGNELTSLDLSKNTSLRVVSCRDNALTSLTLGGNRNLRELYCSGNQLTSIDLSKNTYLDSLFCNNNQITSLVLKDNPYLEAIDCSYNAMTTLNMGTQIHLKSLVCNGNSFQGHWVYIGYCKYLLRLTREYSFEENAYFKECFGTLYAGTPNEVTCRLVIDKDAKIHTQYQDPIDYLNFPDDAFRNYIIENIDTDKSLTLSVEEAKVVELDVSNLGITDLKGIDLFPNLKNLVCSNNHLTSLDLKSNSSLKYLYTTSNDLTSINLENNTALEVLQCENNQLTTLDLSKCTNLTNLYCTGNKISSLNVSNNPNLGVLSCGENQLSAIDVSKNTLLKSFYCDHNQLTSLDVSNNTLLTILRCDNNQISSLDVSKNTALVSLSCESNQISSLDVSKNPELVSLYCESNQISSLDVSKNPELFNLYCSDNHISSLDLSINTKIKVLKCENNELSSIDISKCPDLWLFKCEENQLTSLDISNNPNLLRLSCYKNAISDLYLASCPYLVDTYQNYPPVYYAEGGYMVCAKEENWQELGALLAYDVGVNIHVEKPSPAPVKDPSFEDFVERLYTVALGRASEPEGKAFWVEQVVKNGFTGADCARFFMLGAPEFLGRNLTDDEFVEVLYKTYFDRDSEPDGKAYWLSRLASGTERAVLVEEFIESVEWCNVCATYGVKSGALYHKATIPSKNAVKFATRLYTCCLGRDPEEEGLQYWALALTNLDATGYQAASLFFTLPEFVGLKTTNEEYLTRLYTTFLGREPETDGFNYWLGLLNGGTDRNDVMKAFAGCPEFQEICNQYGIVRGEI